MSDSSDSLLEDRLRATYASLATNTAYAPPQRIDDRTHAPRRRRHTKRMVIALASALVLVLAIVGVLVVLGAHNNGDPLRKVVPPVDNSLFPDVVPHQGAELLLNPRAVPAGYQLVFATGPDGPGLGGGGSPQWTAIQDWVKLDASGIKPVGGFQIAWGPADLAEANGGLSGPSLGHQDALSAYGPDAEPIMVAGKPGIWAERLQAVAWEEGDRVISVSAFMDGPFGTWSDHLTRADIESVASNVAATGNGSYTLAAPPPGYQFAGQAPGFVREGENQRRLVYSDGNNHGFAIQLVDNTQNPPGMALAQSDAQLVEIRGQRAVLTPSLNGGDGAGCSQIDLFLCTTRPGDTSHTYLQWLEPDSTRITITAIGLSNEQVLELARNLEPITTEEWQAIINQTADIPCALTARCK